MGYFNFFFESVMASKEYDQVGTEDGDVEARGNVGCMAKCCECIKTCPGKFCHFLCHHGEEGSLFVCLLTPGHWCQIITFLVTLWIISGLFWYLMFFFVVTWPVEALYAFLVACGLFTALFGVLMATDKDEDDTKLSMGCSVAELKAHIGKTMASDMSWDTFGDNWHIVHKMEIYEDNPSDTAEHRITALCARLHYTNTEPVWAKDMHRGSMMRHSSAPLMSSAPHIEEKTEKVVTLHQ